MCFFLDPSPVRRVPIQTGIQRKLNFVSVRTIKGSSSESWGGSNGKRSKLFSSANGAKTEQTVFSWGNKMDGSTFGTLYCVLIARTQGPDLE
jgi:hypothetical protein